DFKFNKDEIKETYLAYGKKLEPYVVDLSSVLFDAIQDGKNILLEGAQGTHLDIDHGIYPFTTSSNTIAGGACTGCGIGPTMIDNVIGVVKAYTTRVGSGPMPTELNDEIGKYLQTKGGEIGTTTGRIRRCGWLDLVLVRYAVRTNGYTGLAVTKLDVLGGLQKIKVCTKYEYRGKTIKEFPASMKILEECKPVYVEFEGWEDLPKEGWQKIAKKGYYRALPKQMREYMKFISKETGVPIQIISIGEERSLTLDRREVVTPVRGIREEEHD
ncbi:MAG: adenylosuccinate synthetase, partial [Thermoplasmata archaeon]